jgi:hypothetical protein
MNTKVRAPSHVCPQCGEWWAVEPVEQNILQVIRYGDHTRAYKERVFTPKCPDCKTVILEPWLIID